MITAIQNIPAGDPSIISNGKYPIIGDESVYVNGTDMAMAPTQLVLAGILM